MPDVKVARAAADASLDGLAFYRGIPGCIGGALRMNAGAHGGETTDVLVEARGVTRAGRDRHAVPCRYGLQPTGTARASTEEIIFTSALFQGRPGDQAGDPGRDGPGHRRARGGAADQGAHRRLDLQEPAGGKAWQLIDAAGCRGLRVGGAQVSEMHCNFLINTGGGDGRRYRGAGRGGAAAGEGQLRLRTALGDQAAWGCGA